MRKHYNDFNEDYELGYEKGRRDALREINESENVKDEMERIVKAAKKLGLKQKEILYKGKYTSAFELYPLYVIIIKDEDEVSEEHIRYAIKVDPNATDLIKTAVGDESKGSLSPIALGNYAEAFSNVYKFVRKI